MRIEEIVEQIINTVKSDDFFNDVKIIKAYPNSNYPTRLGCDIVAVGLDEIQLCKRGIDELDNAGEISVFVDIFTPVKTEITRASEIFTRLCKCLYCYNLVSISAQRIITDSERAAFVLKTKFTFNDEIEVV